MSKDLTEFLDAEGGPVDAGSSAGGGDSGEAGAAAAPATSVSAPSNEGGKSDSAGAAPAAPAAPDPPEEIPEDVRGLRGALVAEREKRKDHKGRADRFEGELVATKAQLDALLKEKAAPAAPAVPAVPAARTVPPPPNPVEDPAAYHSYWEGRALNDRLNTSEALLRDQKGDADVDAKIEIFQKAVAANPALLRDMHRQPLPYKWMYAQAEKLAALSEVGDDPAAFRARVAAEVRAELEAEYAAKGAPAAPAGAPALLHIPRSLGTAPSAAPRTAVAEEAPEFEDLFKPRRRA